ncbi:hypothetical protein KUV85_13940 [Nocardioides panacisoli]|uniref:hypothetical protein n=1 Tax=Nocardioides panacisoli TaxID=627624 RepID=UPI001C62C328|nr:hypothetical protein [Nocardioides panacisoli]QYJ03420.1 hypothetical protein KUV85_13940 [Nocardioides panacisoli]
MHEIDVTDETWNFGCGHCGHQWSVAYEVHHNEAPGGDQVRMWLRNGRPSMAPGGGVPCPSCQEGLRVNATRDGALERTARRPVDDLMGTGMPPVMRGD